MTDDKELQHKVEAILFAIGKSTELESIANLSKEPDLKKVKSALDEMRQDYDERGSPLMVVEDGSRWKLTVREKHLSIVKNIVADTELTKTVIETLAVIAWKNPLKQSEVIRIRTNKAYDHIKELEELGFITRQKYHRTKLIKLTEKFFQYFELEGDHSIKDVLRAKKPVSGQATLDPEPAAPVQIETYDEEDPERDKALHDEETQHMGKLEVFDEPEGEQAEPASSGPQETPTIPDDIPTTEDLPPDTTTHSEEHPPAEGEAGPEQPEEPAEDVFDEELEKSVVEKHKEEDKEEPQK